MASKQAEQDELCWQGPGDTTFRQQRQGRGGQRDSGQLQGAKQVGRGRGQVGPGQTYRPHTGPGNATATMITRTRPHPVPLPREGRKEGRSERLWEGQGLSLLPGGQWGPRPGSPGQAGGVNRPGARRQRWALLLFRVQPGGRHWSPSEWGLKPPARDPGHSLRL